MIRRLPRSIARKVHDRARLARAAQDGVTLLASYPKCGRTWFRFILAHYLGHAPIPAEPDLTTMFALVPNYDLDPVRGLPAFWRREQAARLPLIAATHAPPGARGLRGARVLLMVRDPRDVMVSSWFHAVHHKRVYDRDLATFVRDAGHGLPRYVAHLNAWAGALRRSPHHVVSYERLSAHPVEEAMAAFRFLGLPIDPDRAAQAVEAASFARLRRMEEAQGLPGRSYDRTDPAASRMRRGVVGGFRDHLDDATVRWIEEYAGRHLGAPAHRLLAGSPPPAVPSPTVPMPVPVPVPVPRPAPAASRNARGEHWSRQPAAEALVALGLLAAVVAPAILLIEVWEWITAGEWPGWSVEDGLGLFGIERGDVAETSVQRMTDVLLAIPLTLALFVTGLFAFLTGVHLGRWRGDAAATGGATG